MFLSKDIVRSMTGPEDTCQVILVISLEQKQCLENISRRIVDQNFIYNSPTNIMQIYASFLSYFQKYDMSRS